MPPETKLIGPESCTRPSRSLIARRFFSSVISNEDTEPPKTLFTFCTANLEPDECPDSDWYGTWENE